MIYGYARVSSKDQNLATQLQALKKFGIDRIFQEKVSGVAKERKELENLMNVLEEGDTIVVARMDRLARSLRHLMQIVEDLQERNVELVTLDYNFDTRTPTGVMLFQIIGAVVEWERSMLKEKQRAGIEQAKREGKKLGREKKWEKKNFERAVKDYLAGDTVGQICDTYNLPRSTFYKFLKDEGIVR